LAIFKIITLISLLVEHEPYIIVSLQPCIGDCSTASLVEASNCVKRVMDKCTGTTDEEQNLQRLFSYKDIEKTARFFCNNFDRKF
jgi:hypothetical protein